MQQHIASVGIVILTHNSSHHIIACLQSIVRNDYVHKQIVVVDNYSTDETVHRIKSNFDLRIICRKKNDGFAKGCNVGIRYLLKNKCEYIVLLNDDTVVKRKFISTLVHSFQIDHSIGIVGSVITYYDQPQIIWCAGGYINRLFFFTRHTGINRPLRIAHSGYTDFISGCAMMIKTKTFKKVGLLDERFGYYFEDVFFCESAGRLGLRSYVICNPLVQHRISSTSGIQGLNIMTPIRSYFFARNPFIYIKNETNILLRLTQTIGQLCIRLPYYLSQNIFRRDPRSLIMYLMGFYEGLFYLFAGRLKNHPIEKIK